MGAHSAVESAFADVVAQVGQANGKATGLLPLFGGAVVGVVALSTRAMPVAAQLLLWPAAGCALAAVLMLLWVVRPQFTDRDDNGFPFLARFADRPSALLEVLRGREGPGDVALAVHTVRLAVIVRRKYVRVRAAVDLIVMAVLLVAVALIVMAVA